MNIQTDPIIQSMLDDDLYKFTQQMMFIELFPNAIGEYRFHNRGKHRFNGDFMDSLKYQIEECLPALKVTDGEIEWLSSTVPYLKPWYLDTLKNYRYNPRAIEMRLDNENNLVWTAKGLCRNEMMWEVKTMATISELYFKTIDTNWNMDGQDEKAREKMKQLQDWGCITTDFGTRRRRSFNTQYIVVKNMRGFDKFVGTSNVYLSRLFNMIPKGTIAHETISAMQALFGIRHSNYFAMDSWVKVYKGDLGIALTDTLGTDQFLKDFDLRFAKLFDGVRCDSGNEMEFVDKMVAHYKKLKIEPMTKTIIFSNALDCRKAVDIVRYCRNVIKCSFGIGTFFSNDFANSPALNMVIKLWSVNGIPVVKLSDDKGKIMGDKDAIKVTKWECFGDPLDS